VPDDQMVSMFVVAPPVPPQAGMPSRTKSVITMLVAGIGLAVLAGVLADLLLTRLSIRRKSRRRRPSEAAAAPESALPPNGTQEPIRPVPVAEDVMEAR
jgi:H+/gluconate symporter-like permease